MKVLACSWMLLFAYLLGHRLIVYGEANKAQVLDNFLGSRLAEKLSPMMYFLKRFDVKQHGMQSQEGSMETDKISALPGQPEGVDFNHYSGYVTVDSKAGRALFYYFAESPENSSANPLVLWFNGGPACSSLMGAMTELGPFRVNNDGKTLFRNNYAWNNVANVIFIESPAGVGFSYSNTTSDYQRMGDKSTAKDAYTFLVNWLERFPQYKTRDLYITGESYGGHYVPQLANSILHKNKKSNQTLINLIGIAVGNGVIDERTFYLGRYDYFWTHALNSDETNKGIHTYCHYFTDKDSEQCKNFKDISRTERGDIDHYNIYAPRCQLNSHSSIKISSDSVNSFDPCSNHYMLSYLNRADVQAALHAKVSTWDICNHSMRRGWIDRATTILPIIKNLTSNGIRIWLYSGDLDSVVPVTSTRYAINKLKLPIKTAWRPWSTDGEIVGRHGRALSVFIANKRSRGGTRFAFLRVGSKDEALRLTEKLNGLQIYSSRISVGLAKYDKRSSSANAQARNVVEDERKVVKELALLELSWEKRASEDVIVRKEAWD
ncbi:Serine carboxypeptidase-like 40 [Hibiscus syriacus]|uniref:Carboxypeptidase n=1 Tax=Hibiscus syriacus TaxID=106335 RepID=A0A6A2XDU9_HIBSY|nr:Serine carboxypeptidase-like 40 [Hibiscus syriacus]